MIWSTAGMMKSWNWISAMGRRPLMAAPMATPTMADSASGVSMTRISPNSWCSPSVALNTPPLTPTSSPMTMTRSSLRISSRMPSRIASMYVFTGIGLALHNVEKGRFGGGERRGLRLVHRGVDLAERFRTDLVGIIGSQDSRLLQELLEAEHAVVLLLLGERLARLVDPVVVVGGVRGETGHLGLDERRSLTAAATFHRLLHRRVAGDGIAAVDD